MENMKNPESIEDSKGEVVLKAYSDSNADLGRVKEKEAEAENNVVTAGFELEAIVPGSKEDPFRNYRIIKQICLVLIWICIGLYAEIVGPTLPDLTDQLGVNYEQISRALSGKSIGLMIGAVIGGFLHEKFYRQTDLIMSIGLYLASLATILTPLSTSLAMAGCAFCLNGFAEGLINTGGNTMVMHLWGSEAASPMHSLHFGFGFGALLAPQIAKPFLGPDTDNDTDVYNALFNATTQDPLQPARIKIPYGIIALFIFLFAFVVLAFYIKGTPPGFPVRENKTQFKTMVSPGSCTGGRVLFGIQLFLCLWLYFIQAVGGERVMGKFIFSYARERTPRFTNSEASNLNSLFWLSFTIGRGAGVPIAKLVRVQWIIVGDVIASILVSIVLAAFAEESDVILWVFVALMGLCISVAFPNGMSWANLHLAMNSVGVMVLMVGGSFGGLFYQLATGTLFEQDPNNLMYVLVFFAVMLGVAFALMEFFGRNGRKKVTQEPDMEIEVGKEEEGTATSRI